MGSVDYPKGNRLVGKVALVTGAARGLGASFARAMVAQGASVVLGVMRDEEGLAVEAEFGDAAKFGLRGLTKAVALDLSDSQVRCNSVHPGAVLTPMTDGMDVSQFHVAMKRAGHPHELAHLVVFLASDESSYCTGAEFVADGGEMAGLASLIVASQG